MPADHTHSAQGCFPGPQHHRWCIRTMIGSSKEKSRGIVKSRFGWNAKIHLVVTNARIYSLCAAARLRIRRKGSLKIFIKRSIWPPLEQHGSDPQRRGQLRRSRRVRNRWCCGAARRRTIQLRERLRPQLELAVVEGVEHLSAKLEIEALHDLEVLHKPKIKVVHSGSDELIAAP